MGLTDEFKNEINEMSYFDMLKEWRFSPLPNDRFFGEKGDYFGKIMQEKREALPDGKAAAISKQIGWNY